jgi:hypothetical protein
LARVLNPLRFGVFSFQVWSHKVMRWLVPWFLLGTLLTAIALRNDAVIYRVALWAQLAAYSLVLIAHFATRVRQIGLMRIGYYFIQANMALAHAAVLYFSGKRIVVWNPSVR